MRLLSLLALFAGLTVVMHSPAAMAQSAYQLQQQQKLDALNAQIQEYQAQPMDPKAQKQDDISGLSAKQQEAYMAKLINSPSFHSHWRQTSQQEKKQFCQNAMEYCQKQAIMTACDFHKRSCSSK